ncbi:MAG: hypothetical protein IPP90_03425 [Gemmatimonadaceae bacterium]|nr:hypothetical protein [Gemmatimonadaceae bacterium]
MVRTRTSYGMHRIARLVATLLALFFAGAGACQHVTGPAPGIPYRRVLFVGNSLTAVNALPSMVSAVASRAAASMYVESVTGGGLALIDHLTGSTDAAQRIRHGHFDLIVLQQGPTPRGLCRDSLVLWSQMFAQLAHQAHADVALLMTWPARGASESAFDDVRVSFQQAAYETRGVFLPVGEAWRELMTLDATLEPYGPDGFHPSPMGTYLAALTIVERLIGIDIREVSLAPPAIGIPLLNGTTLGSLQRAAHAANARFPTHPDQSAANPTPPGATLPGGHC